MSAAAFSLCSSHSHVRLLSAMIGVAFGAGCGGDDGATASNSASSGAAGTASGGTGAGGNGTGGNGAGGAGTGGGGAGAGGRCTEAGPVTVTYAFPMAPPE